MTPHLRSQVEREVLRSYLGVSFERNAYEHRYPLSAAQEAILRGDVEAAVDIVRRHWLKLIMDGHGGEIDRFLTLLPGAAADAELVAIRACIARMNGDGDGGRLLADRARSIDRGPRPLHALLYEDDDDALSSAVDGALGMLEHGDVAATCRPYVLLIVGRVLLHLSRDPLRMLRVLAAARHEAEAADLPQLVGRIETNFAFALTQSARFDEAQELLARQLWRPTTRDAADAGIVEATYGCIAYWRGAYADAERWFRAGADVQPRSGYAFFAAVHLGMLAATHGTAHDRAEALVLLQSFPTDTFSGIPRLAWRQSVEALIARAEGNSTAALMLARRALAHTTVPALVGPAADILVTEGDLPGAAAMLESVDRRTLGPAVRVQFEAIRARIAHARRSERIAHARLEKALDAAAPERIWLPFLERHSSMETLLAEHTRWGTRHEAVVHDLLRLRAQDVREAGPTLTRREREVLTLLRSPLSTEEIAHSLQISVNTAKTHIRAIYRKLGVSSRREAIRTGT